MVAKEPHFSWDPNHWIHCRAYSSMPYTSILFPLAHLRSLIWASPRVFEAKNLQRIWICLESSIFDFLMCPRVHVSNLTQSNFVSWFLLVHELNSANSMLSLLEKCLRGHKRDVLKIFFLTHFFYRVEQKAFRSIESVRLSLIQAQWRKASKQLLEC